MLWERVVAVVVAVFSMSACGRLFYDGEDGQGGQDGAVFGDSQVPMAPFGAATEVLVNTGSTDRNASATADLLELYHRSNRGGAVGNGAIWRALRGVAGDAWGTPELVAELDVVGDLRSPEVSSDGLTIYFASDRLVPGELRLYSATRAGRGQTAFAAPELLPGLENQAAFSQTVTDDALSTVFTISNGDYDLYEARRASVEDPFGVPVAIASVNTAGIDDSGAFLSRDGLTLYFDRQDPSEPNDSDVYVAYRTSRDEDFGLATIVPGLDTPMVTEMEVWISPAGDHAFFTSDPDGQDDIYESHR